MAVVTLPFHDRHRRRVRLEDDDGQSFLLDLPRATLLRDGDGLRLEGGGYIRVVAADEAILDVYCLDTEHTARVAWHVGNRHVALQVLPGGGLRIEYDHVLAEMLEGLGARLEPGTAPFRPEPGAYSGHRHQHEHGNE